MNTKHIFLQKKLCNFVERPSTQLHDTNHMPFSGKMFSYNRQFYSYRTMGYISMSSRNERVTQFLTYLQKVILKTAIFAKL